MLVMTDVPIAGKLLELADLGKKDAAGILDALATVSGCACTEYEFNGARYDLRGDAICRDGELGGGGVALKRALICNRGVLAPALSSRALADECSPLATGGGA